MARGSKIKADCRADTRGGSWAGIPKCLIESAAYRALSVHARAVLVELTARMNGYNNGEIGCAQRQLVEAIGCHNRRIIAAIAELVEHCIIDVAVEGQWKQRQARLYRLTFVSTKRSPATNEYLRWTPSKAKSRDAIVEPANGQTDATMEAGSQFSGAAMAPRKPATRRSVVFLPDASVAPLILSPSSTQQSAADAPLL